MPKKPKIMGYTGELTMAIFLWYLNHWLMAKNGCIRFFVVCDSLKWLLNGWLVIGSKQSEKAVVGALPRNSSQIQRWHWQPVYHQTARRQYADCRWHWIHLQYLCEWRGKKSADQYRIEVIDYDGKIFDGNLESMWHSYKMLSTNKTKNNVHSRLNQKKDKIFILFYFYSK